MTKSEKAELLKLVHKCALLVCEARNFLEELEQKGIDNIFGDSKNKKSLNQGSNNSTIDFTINNPTPVSADNKLEESKHKNFFN